METKRFTFVIILIKQALMIENKDLRDVIMSGQTWKGD